MSCNTAVLKWVVMSFHSLQLCPVTGLHLPLVCLFQYNREACGRGRRKRCLLRLPVLISGSIFNNCCYNWCQFWVIPSGVGRWSRRSRRRSFSPPPMEKKEPWLMPKKLHNLKPGIQNSSRNLRCLACAKINCHRHVIIWMWSVTVKAVDRVEAVAGGLQARAWKGYKSFAWGHDELKPYLRPMQSGSAWAWLHWCTRHHVDPGLKDGESYNHSFCLPVRFMTTVLRFQIYSCFFPIVNMRGFLQPQHFTFPDVDFYSKWPFYLIFFYFCYVKVTLKLSCIYFFGFQMAFMYRLYYFSIVCVKIIKIKCQWSVFFWWNVKFEEKSR